MSLKRNWLKRGKEKEKKKEKEKENQELEEKPDLYTQLQREIRIIRKQGEPPEKDTMAFSRYVCDLCNTSHSISELRQCAVCGRWACQSCWTPEYYLCSSCSGIVALKNIKL